MWTNSGHAGFVTASSVSKITIKGASTQDNNVIDSTIVFTLDAPDNDLLPSGSSGQNSTGSIRNLVGTGDVGGLYVTPIQDADSFNMTFSQFASLEVNTVYGNDHPKFSTASGDTLLVEVETTLTFNLSIPAFLETGYLSIDPNSTNLYVGYTETSGSGITAEATTNSIPPAPSLTAILSQINQTSVPQFFDKGVYSVTFLTKVTPFSYTNTSTNPNVIGRANFDMTLQFAPAPVPEPASCLVAGVLFGSVVIGKRLRRRRNA